MAVTDVGYTSLREQVGKKIENSLGADYEVGLCSGNVLYSGWRTLCLGLAYVMGFNPGGKPADIQKGILESLSAKELEDKEYSAYKCSKETWDWHGRRMPPGWEHPHQRRVIELVNCFNIDDVADVFATNAIFVRSQTQDSLQKNKATGEVKRLWDICWPIHQFFFSIVRPRIILCLGNGDRVSAFTLFHNRFPSAPVECLREGRTPAHVVRWFTSDIDLGSDGSIPRCLVVGVPHPSRFDVSQNIKEFLQSRTAFLATSH